MIKTVGSTVARMATERAADRTTRETRRTVRTARPTMSSNTRVRSSEPKELTEKPQIEPKGTTTGTNTIFDPKNPPSNLEDLGLDLSFLNSPESLFDFTQAYPEMKNSPELQNFFGTNDYQLLEGESSKAINRILFDYNLGGI